MRATDRIADGGDGTIKDVIARIWCRWPMRGIAAVGFSMLMFTACTVVGAGETADYQWRQVGIGGGGYVTGAVIHPTMPNLLYIRTDVGGAYRSVGICNDKIDGWVPITDQFSFDERNQYGIESVAIDPSDSDIVYIAAGRYDWAGPGKIFRSTDRGKSWKDTGIRLIMRGGGPLRATGEKLVVDPNNGDIVYFGSRNDGLWRSLDGAQTWHQVEGLDARGKKGIGISFVDFDKSRFKASRTTRLYVGVYGEGIFRSDNGGLSFQAIGGPRRPRRARVTPEGILYVTAATGVFALTEGQWTDLSPKPGKKFGALGIDPADSSKIVVAESNSSRNLPLYRTTDGGRHWSKLTVENMKIDPVIPWWSRKHFASAPSTMLFDPHVPGRLWMTDWYGVWRTDDIYAERPNWKNLSNGIEEIVTFTLMTPPKGVALLSGVADVNGFRHRKLDAYPRSRFRGIGIWNSMGMDYHEADPSFMVRVGSKGLSKKPLRGGGGYSTDFGKTWKPFPKWPFGVGAKVAYSSTNPLNVVILPLDGIPMRTLDRGQTWQPAEGVPAPVIRRYWHWDHPLAADRVDGNRFYVLVGRSMYRSDDGGKVWHKTADLAKSRHAYVEAAPGVANNVWVSLDKNGVYRSKDGGESFDKVPAVSRSLLFGFGKGKDSAGVPAAYIFGSLGDEHQLYVYRSDDMGETWTRLNDDSYPLGFEPNVLRGDRQVYGRVFVGSNGRGIHYGEPLLEPPADSVPPVSCVRNSMATPSIWQRLLNAWN